MSLFLTRPTRQEEPVVIIVHNHSYDPWPSCMRGDYYQICHGHSGNVWLLCRLGSSGYGSLHPDRRRVPVLSWGQRWHCQCGSDHPWPLLANRSPYPPSQVLSQMDVVYWAVVAMVGRICCGSAARDRYNQNRQRNMQTVCIPVVSIYGKGSFVTMWNCGW